MDKQQKMTLRILKKSVAFFLAIFFTVLNLSQYVPFSYAQFSNPGQLEATPLQVLTAGQIKLPADLGVIQEVYSSLVTRDSSPIVILVQDAHTLPEAQRSIQKIIEYFQEHDGLKSVALEGGQGRLDPLLFRAYPDVNRLRGIFDRLLQKGEISGAVSAALFNKKEADYYGIEDQALYEEGISNFLQAQKTNPRLLERIAHFQKRIDRQKEKIYPETVLKLDQALRTFDAQQIDLEGFLKILKSFKRDFNPQYYLNNFPHLEALFKELQANQSTVAIQGEIEKLIKAVKPLLGNPEEIKNFNTKYQDYQTDVLPPKDFGCFLYLLAQKKGLDLFSYPALRTASSYYPLIREMQAPIFYKELENFIHEIKSAALVDSKAKRLDQLDRRLRLLDRLAHLELTRDEWGEVEKLKSEKVEKFQVGKSENLLAFKHLNLSTHFEFYKNAEERDAAFFRNLLKLMNSAKTQSLTQYPHPSNSTLLVTGGFHVKGLAEALKREGISYVLISPRITDVPRETPYLRVMKGDVTWKKYLRVKEGKVSLYDSFVRSITAELNQAPGADQSRTLKIWRDDVIRSLAAQKHLERAGTYTRFIDSARIESLHPDELKNLRTLVSSRMEHFLAGLKDLVTQNHVTEMNLLRLFQTPSTLPPVVGPMLMMPESEIPAEFLGITSSAQSAPRAEVRPNADALGPQNVFATRRSEVRNDTSGERSDIVYLNQRVNHWGIGEIAKGELLAILQSSREPYSDLAVDVLIWLASKPKLPANMKVKEIFWAIRELSHVPGLHRVLEHINPFNRSTQVGFLSEILFAYQKQLEGYEVLAMDTVLPPNVEVDIVLSRNHYALNLFDRVIKLPVELNALLKRMLRTYGDQHFPFNFIARARTENIIVESKYFSHWRKYNGRPQPEEEVVKSWMEDALKPKIKKYSQVIQEAQGQGMAFHEYPGLESFQEPEHFKILVSDSILKPFGRKKRELKQSEIEALYRNVEESELGQGSKTGEIEILSVNLPITIQKQIEADLASPQILFNAPPAFLRELRESRRKKMQDRTKQQVKNWRIKPQVLPAAQAERFLQDMFDAYIGNGNVQNGEAAIAAQNIQAIFEQLGHSKLLTRDRLFRLALGVSNGDRTANAGKQIFGAWLRSAPLEIPSQAMEPEEILNGWASQLRTFAGHYQTPQIRSEVRTTYSAKTGDRTVGLQNFEIYKEEELSRKRISWNVAGRIKDPNKAPDLFAYSVDDQLRGIWIDPKFRRQGFLRPLLNSFFTAFPEVERTYPFIKNLALLHLLIHEYGFEGENEKIKIERFGQEVYEVTVGSNPTRWFVAHHGIADELRRNPLGISLVKTHPEKFKEAVSFEKPFLPEQSAHASARAIIASEILEQIRRLKKWPLQKINRILLVDPDESMRLLTTEALRMILGNGVSIEEADSAEEIARKLESQTFDLIFTAQNFPGLPGLELVRMIRRTSRSLPTPRDVPIVIMTADVLGFFITNEQLNSLGATLFLQKPFRLQSLEEIVKAGRSEVRTNANALVLRDNFRTGRSEVRSERPSEKETVDSETVRRSPRAFEYIDSSQQFTGVDLEHFVHAQNRLAEKLLSEKELKEVLEYLRHSEPFDRHPERSEGSQDKLREESRSFGLRPQDDKEREENYRMIYRELASGRYDKKAIDLINGNSYEDPRLAIEIIGQNSNPRAQGIYEAVANSLDALGFNIGQFGKGVKQIIDWLEPNGKDRIDVLTKRNKEAYRLTILRDEKGQPYIQIKKISNRQFRAVIASLPATNLGGRAKQSQRSRRRSAPRDDKAVVFEQGTVVQVTLQDRIPQSEEELDDTHRNSQAGIAEGIHKRFPYVTSIQITTQTAQDQEPQQVNGFEEKKVIVPSQPVILRPEAEESKSEILRSAQDDRTKTIKVLFSDQSMTVIDNGKGMDAELLSRMFVPKQGAKHPAPLSGDQAKAELAKVKVVQDESLPHRVSFARNGEVVRAVDIPKDISEMATTRGGLMIEFGSLLDVPESRDNIIIPLDLRPGEISNFQLAVQYAISQIAAHPALTALEKVQYINTLIVGLDGLIQGNENYAYTVKNSRAFAREIMSPFVKQLKEEGYILLPHHKQFGKISIPSPHPSPRGRGQGEGKVVFLHENLFDWQGALSLAEIGGVKVPGITLAGEKRLPLIVIPFKPESVEKVSVFNRDWHTWTTEERLPVIKTDRFIAIPEELGKRLYQLAVRKMKRSPPHLASPPLGGEEKGEGEEDKEFLSLVQQVNILTAEEVATSYEMSRPKENINLVLPEKFQKSTGEIDSEVVNSFLTHSPALPVLEGQAGQIPSDANQKYIVLEDGRLAEAGGRSKIDVALDAFGPVDKIEPLINGYYLLTNKNNSMVGNFRNGVFNLIFSGRQLIISPDKKFVTAIDTDSDLQPVYSFETEKYYYLDNHFETTMGLPGMQQKYTDPQFSRDGKYLTYLETESSSGMQYFVAVDLQVKKIIKRIELGENKYDYSINPFADAVFIQDKLSDFPHMIFIDLTDPSFDKFNDDYAKYLHTDSSGTYTVAIDHDGEMKIYLYKAKTWIGLNNFYKGEIFNAGVRTMWKHGQTSPYKNFSVDINDGSVVFNFDATGLLFDAPGYDYFEDYSFSKVASNGVNRLGYVSKDGENEEVVAVEDISTLDPLQKLNGKTLYKHSRFELLIDNRDPENPVAIDPKTGKEFSFQEEIVHFDRLLRNLIYRRRDGWFFSATYIQQNELSTGFPYKGSIDKAPAQFEIAPDKGMYALDEFREGGVRYQSIPISSKQYSSVSFDGKYFVFADPKTGDVVYLDPEKPDQPVFVPLKSSTPIYTETKPADAPNRFIVVPTDPKKFDVYDMVQRKLLGVEYEKIIRINANTFLLKGRLEDQLVRIVDDGNIEVLLTFDNGRSVIDHNEKLVVIKDSEGQWVKDVTKDTDTIDKSFEAKLSASGRFSIHRASVVQGDTKGALVYYDHEESNPVAHLIADVNDYSEYLVHDRADLVVLKNEQGKYAIYNLREGGWLTEAADHVEIDSSGMMALILEGENLTYVNLKNGDVSNSSTRIDLASDGKYIYVRLFLDWTATLFNSSEEDLWIYDKKNGAFVARGMFEDFSKPSSAFKLPRFWEAYDLKRKIFWDREYPNSDFRFHTGQFNYRSNPPTTPLYSTRLSGSSLLVEDLSKDQTTLKDLETMKDVKTFPEKVKPDSLQGGKVWYGQSENGSLWLRLFDKNFIPVKGLINESKTAILAAEGGKVYLINSDGVQINLTDQVSGGFLPTETNGDYFVFANPDQPGKILCLDPSKGFSKKSSLAKELTPEEREEQTKALDLWNQKVLSKREVWIVQARAAYQPFLALIPEEFREEMRSEIVFYTRDLYREQEKEILRRYDLSRKGQKPDWNAPLPFDIFTKRMKKITEQLPSYLHSVTSEIAQENFYFQKRYYENLFEGLFRLAMEFDLEVSAESLNERLFDVLALTPDWDLSSQKTLETLPLMSQLFDALKKATRDQAKRVEIQNIFNFLATALSSVPDVVTEQIEKIMKATPQAKTAFLRHMNEAFASFSSENEIPVYEEYDSKSNSFYDYEELGGLRPFVVFLTQSVEQLKENEPFIPEGEDVAMPKAGIEISQIIKLEQQRSKRDEEDIVMNVEDLISNLNHLPAHSDALEAEILKNAKVQRESGAYAAEITQNSLDAARDKQGELVVDFYLQKRPTRHSEAEGRRISEILRRSAPQDDVEEEYVEEAADNGTGALQEVALLIPKSTKAQGKQIDLTGFFGTGKYTIFEGVDRVEIITKNQDRAFMFTFTVIKDETGMVTAIKLTGIRKITDSRVAQGVTVRRIKTSENTIPELDQMLAQRAWKTFAGLAQNENFSIVFIDHEGKKQPLIVEKEVLSEAEFKVALRGITSSPLAPRNDSEAVTSVIASLPATNLGGRAKQSLISFGSLRILSTKDFPLQIIDKVGLRVSDLKEEYLALIPIPLRKHLRELGIVIQIPLPLIRNRSAFEHENNYLPMIQKYVAVEFYKAIAYKTLTQTKPQFVFEGFPLDWETNDSYWNSIHLGDKDLLALAGKMNEEKYKDITEQELKNLLTQPGRLDKEKKFVKLMLLLEVAADKTKSEERISLLLRRLAIQEKLDEQRAKRQAEMLKQAGFTSGKKLEAEQIPFYQEKIRKARNIEIGHEQMRNPEKYLIDLKDYTREEQMFVHLAGAIGRHFGIEQILLLKKEVLFAGAFRNYNKKTTMFLNRAIALKIAQPKAGFPIIDEASDTIVHELAHLLEEFMRGDEYKIWQEGFVSHLADFTHDSVGTFAEAMKYVSAVALANHGTSTARSEVRAGILSSNPNGERRLTQEEEQVVAQLKKEIFDPYFEKAKQFPYSEEVLDSVKKGVNWGVSVRDRFVDKEGTPSLFHSLSLLSFFPATSHLRQNLVNIQQDFENTIPFHSKFYRTPAQALHLTLLPVKVSKKMPVAPEEVDEAGNQIADWVKDIQPFDIWVEGLTVDENSGRILAQVFPLASSNGDDVLLKLAKKKNSVAVRQRATVTLLTPFQPLTKRERSQLIAWVQKYRENPFGRLTIKKAYLVHTSDSFALRRLESVPYRLGIQAGTQEAQTFLPRAILFQTLRRLFKENAPLFYRIKGIVAEDIEIQEKIRTLKESRFPAKNHQETMDVWQQKQEELHDKVREEVAGKVPDDFVIAMTLHPRIAEEYLEEIARRQIPNSQQAAPSKHSPPRSELRDHNRLNIEWGRTVDLIAKAVMSEQSPAPEEIRKFQRLLEVNKNWKKIERTFRKTFRRFILEPDLFLPAESYENTAPSIPNSVLAVIRENPIRLFEILHLLAGRKEAVPQVNAPMAFAIHAPLIPLNAKEREEVIDKTLKKNNYLILPFEREFNGNVSRQKLRKDALAREIYDLKDPILSARFRPVEFVETLNDQKLIDKLHSDVRQDKLIILMADGSLMLSQGKKDSALAFVIQPEILSILKLGEILFILQMIGSAPEELRQFYREQLGLRADPKTGITSIGRAFLDNLTHLVEMAQVLQSAA